MDLIIAFLTLRFYRLMPAIPKTKIYSKLWYLAEIHRMRFEENEIIIPKNDQSVQTAEIAIPYKNIINIELDKDSLLILLRTGYYYRFYVEKPQRIYGHLYYNSQKEDNWLVR